MDNWERLERVIKWTGLSVNSFALTVGLKRSENLYQIKKGNNGISRDLAELITTKYNSISKGWLLTGEGDMFVEICTPTPSEGVPYYAVDAVTAVSGEQSEPHFYINIPSLDACDLAALSLGTAMQPEIPEGATVLLKQWPVTSIIPGECYLIITPHFRGIRSIRQGDDAASYLLLPRNSADYDPITIRKSEIKDLYIIRGIIIKKNL